MKNDTVHTVCVTCQTYTHTVTHWHTHLNQHVITRIHTKENWQRSMKDGQSLTLTHTQCVCCLCCVMGLSGVGLQGLLRLELQQFKVKKKKKDVLSVHPCLFVSQRMWQWLTICENYKWNVFVRTPAVQQTSLPAWLGITLSGLALTKCTFHDCVVHAQIASEVYALSLTLCVLTFCFISTQTVVDK